MESEWITADRFCDQDLDQFICIICSNVATNPQMCSKCEHIYCNNCITLWLKSNNYCPYKCDDKNEMKLNKLHASIKNVYLALKVKCSIPGCNEVVCIRDLFKHENFCGTVKCQNSERCQQAAPLIMLDKRVCSEKCYIYLKMKERADLSDDLLFKLLNNYADSLNNNKSMIKTFHSFWIDFTNQQELELVTSKAKETI